MMISGQKEGGGVYDIKPSTCIHSLAASQRLFSVVGGGWWVGSWFQVWWLVVRVWYNGLRFSLFYL